MWESQLIICTTKELQIQIHFLEWRCTCISINMMINIPLEVTFENKLIYFFMFSASSFLRSQPDCQTLSWSGWDGGGGRNLPCSADLPEGSRWVRQKERGYAHPRDCQAHTRGREIPERPRGLCDGQMHKMQKSSCINKLINLISYSLSFWMS